MHVLHLPSRQLLRVTLLAALLTALVMGALLVPAGRLGSATSPATSAPDVRGATAPAAQPTTVRPPLRALPVWLRDPVVTPRLGAPSGGA